MHACSNVEAYTPWAGRRKTRTTLRRSRLHVAWAFAYLRTGREGAPGFRGPGAVAPPAPPQGRPWPLIMRDVTLLLVFTFSSLRPPERRHGGGAREEKDRGEPDVTLLPFFLLLIPPPFSPNLSLPLTRERRRLELPELDVAGNEAPGAISILSGPPRRPNLPEMPLPRR